MRAKVIDFHSPDIADLEKFHPTSSFGFLLQISVGSDEARGEEIFSLMVCSPEWLGQQLEEREIRSLRHYIATHRYDWDSLRRWLTDAIAACEGDTWDEVADRVSRLALSEFEDLDS